MTDGRMVDHFLEAGKKILDDNGTDSNTYTNSSHCTLTT